MIVFPPKPNTLGLSDKSRILVECKHYAKSNTSVREKDLKNFLERTLSHNCNCYLLITSTIPSSSVIYQLEGIDKNPTLNVNIIIWAKNNL